FVHPM
uniref:Electrin-3 n=1 Tax=Litoria rubella TaxID=104895 RepID=EI03_LITRU